MIKDLMFDKSGSLTRELLLEPGSFGLGKVPSRLKPNATTTTVCGFCSTGCGLNVHLKDQEAVNLSPASPYPVNLGMACPKGWEALTPLAAKDRGTDPLLRAKSGIMQAVPWEKALETFCDRLKKIQAEHGPDSLAFLSTGQIVTEEMALLGAMAKFEMGMVHGDGNTRQCMATAAVAYKESFGFDAPPYSYQDFEASNVIVLVGSNLCIAHPIMWERVLMNKRNPKIIVIDPRSTETAQAATEHVRLNPKSDLALFYGIARFLIEQDWLDHNFLDAHTTRFADFKRQVQAFTLDRVVEATGLPAEQIEALARSIGTGGRVSLWWTMGVNQSYEGVRTAQALINLALMTGNIGKPGTGANSITGQCNAMGSRLFSNTTNLLGGRDFTRQTHRREVAKRLGLPPEKIPDRNSLPYNQIIDEISAGRIKGLWIIATNPAHSWIHQNRFKSVVEQLDFLVVQDMYPTTETAQLADLYLPAAGWGEKEGTFINSERRIGLTKKVARAPGRALSDFSIFRLVGEAWGCGDWLDEWKDPESVFHILKKLSVGQPCDISGIRDYRMLDEHGGIQWPCVEKDPKQQRRLFDDGTFYHPNGKARFIFEEPGPLPEPPDDIYPFQLLTGRGSAAQWHTETRTGKSEVLKKLHPKNPYVEINPADAQRRGIKPNQAVSVESRRGSIKLQAHVTHAVREGELFIPMHDAKTNQLTLCSFDPYSFQPSYKACAVRLVP